MTVETDGFISPVRERSPSPSRRRDRRSVSPQRDNDIDMHNAGDDRYRKDMDYNDQDSHRREEIANNPGNNLYVASIPRNYTEEDLKQLCSEYGRVVKVEILRDPKSNFSRNFGFVQMEDPKDAEVVIQNLNGKQIGNYTLVVQMAKRSRARTPTPGKYHGTLDRRSRRGGYHGGYGYPPRREYGGRGGDPYYRYDYPPRRYEYRDERYDSRDRGRPYRGPPPYERSRHDYGDSGDRSPPPPRDDYMDRPPRGMPYDRRGSYSRSGPPPRDDRMADGPPVKDRY